MNFVGKILPVEGYFVQLKKSPPFDYAKSLTHLYQPLIGIEATTLYQTLLHEIEIQDDSTLQTHHTLMNYLNISLDKIYKARLKLEGIGLLKTFKNKENGNNSYIYELQSPFAPEKFFKDAMLSELLYHHLGQTKFESLKKRYHNKWAVDIQNEVTTSFVEVFQTFQPIFDNMDQAIDSNPTDRSIKRVDTIDFSWMEMMLKQRMIPVQRVLTLANKKMISEMMFLYDLTTYEIEKSVLWALTEENALDVDEFKTACHDLFKSKKSETSIKLTEKSPEQIKKQIKKTQPKTKEEQLIERLETISPKDLLEDLSSGNQASAQDMRVIQEVMTSQGLPSPVMNVLIHYVLLQSNMKLSKAYLEKIASHWSRANLKTAKEAMMFAKKEIERFQKGNKRQFQNKASNEIIPDWFKERDSKQLKQSPSKKEDKGEKDREELAALIRQYAGD